MSGLLDYAPDPRWPIRQPSALTSPLLRLAAARSDPSRPFPAGPTIWDRLRTGGEKLLGIPQGPGLLSPEDRHYALRQGLLSVGAGVAGSDPAQGVLHALAQGLSAGQGGAIQGVQTADAYRARAVSLDKARRLNAIEQKYLGQTDPAALKAYARDLYLGGFGDQAYKVAEGIKAMQPEKPDYVETTDKDGVVRLIDKANPKAPPIVLGPVGKGTEPKDPKLEKIDVPTDPGHQHWGRYDETTKTLIDTGARVGVTDPNAGPQKITPEMMRQAGIGGSAAQAYVTMHRIETQYPEAKAEVARALASPDFIKVLPFIGTKLAGAVTAARQVGMHGPAQEYVNAMWELGGQAARQQGRGMTRSLPVLQQLYLELGANPGEGGEALAQKRKNRFNVVLAAKDQSSEELMRKAFKERGLSWEDVFSRSPYAPNQPAAQPTGVNAGNAQDVLDLYP